MCPFGSSTSQSRYCIFCPNSLTTWARLTAIVVFPVPPLPLATATTRSCRILIVRNKMSLDIGLLCCGKLAVFEQFNGLGCKSSAGIEADFQKISYWRKSTYILWAYAHYCSRKNPVNLNFFWRSSFSKRCDYKKMEKNVQSKQSSLELSCR